MPSGSFVALTPEELAETLGGTPTAPVTAAPKATAATPKGRGSSYVELTPDELAEALGPVTRAPVSAVAASSDDAPEAKKGFLSSLLPAGGVGDPMLVPKNVPSGAVTSVGSALRGGYGLEQKIQRNITRPIFDPVVKALGLEQVDEQLGNLQDNLSEAITKPILGLGKRLQAGPQDTLTAQIGQAGGQLGVQVGTNLLGMGAITGPMMFAQGADQIDQEAVKAGNAGTPGADAAAVGGAAVMSLLEKVGLDRVLKGLPEGVRHNILTVAADKLKAGGVEALTEFAQQVVQNTGVKLGINPDQEVLEGASNSGLVGGIAGTAVSAMLGGHGRNVSTRPSTSTPGRASPGFEPERQIGSVDPSNLLTPETPQTSPQTSPQPAPVRQAQQPDLFDGDSLDQLLARGIRPTETGTKPNQVSEAGAVGAHQLLPSTAMQMAKRLGVEYDAKKLLNDPAYNAKLAKEYMTVLTDRYGGDMFKAVTAYHAGENNVDRWVRRFGDPNEIGHEAWLDKVEAAGSPRSAAYPRKVFAAMGQDLGGTTQTAQAAPATEIDPSVYEEVSAPSLTAMLRQANVGADGKEYAPTATVTSVASKVSKSLQDGDVETARATLDKERAKLERELSDLGDKQAAISQDNNSPEDAAKYTAEVEKAADKLFAKDRVLTAAAQIVDRFEERLGTVQPDMFLSQTPAPEAVAAPETQPVGPALDTTPQVEPGQAEFAPEPAPENAPSQESGFAPPLPGLDNFDPRTATNANSKLREHVLESVLSDPDTRSPMSRFRAELRKRGVDPAVAEHEAERIAKFEDAREAAIQRGAAPVAESPEFQAQPEATGFQAAPAKAEPAPKIEAAPVTDNVQPRALAHADTLGSSQRAWFLRGVDNALGISETTAPTGSRPHARWFADGQKFVADETAHQRRERGEEAAGSERPAAGGAPAAVPATDAGLKSRTSVAAKAAAKPKAPTKVEPAAETQPQQSAPRGGKSRFEDAVYKAETAKQITPRDGMALRAAAEAAWDQDMWNALDTAIVENAAKGVASESKLQRTAAPAEDGDTNHGYDKQVHEKATAYLRIQLDKMGLHDVGLKLSSKVALYMKYGARADGSFTSSENLIRVALDAANPVQTTFHEAIHAMRDLDLFTKAEWKTLSDFALTSPAMAEARELYTGSDQETLIEEAIAESFARYANSKVASLPKPVLTLRQKVLNVLKAIKAFFVKQGYTSAEDIFEAARDGTLGGRERGVMRQGPRVEEYFQPEQSVQLQRTSPEKDTKDAEARARAFTSSLPKVVQTALKAGVDISTSDPVVKSIQSMTTMRELAHMASKLMPSAEKYVSELSQSHALSRSYTDRMNDITSEYDMLPDMYKGDGRGSISEYMVASRKAGVWGYTPSWLPDAPTSPEMIEKFEALKDPRAQAVVKAMFLFNKETQVELGKLFSSQVAETYAARIADASTPEEKAAMEREQAQMLKLYSRMTNTDPTAPYSPEVRVGDYATVAWSKEYNDALEADDKEALGKLKSQGDHYWVNFFPSLRKAQAMADKLKEKGHYEFSHGFQRDQATTDLLGDGGMVAALAGVKEQTASMLEATPLDPITQQLHQLATDTWLRSLASSSARKGEMHADLVNAIDPETGRGLDMVRGFVSRGQSVAHFVAQMANAPAVQEAMHQMDVEARQYIGTPKYAVAQRYKNALLAHRLENLSHKTGPLVNKMLRATSLMMLSLNPAYHINNATQSWVFVLPQVGGYVNPARAVHLMTSAYAQVRALAPHPITRHMDIRPLEASDPEAFKFAKYMQDNGAFGTGLATEMGEWVSDGNGLLPKAWRKVDKTLRVGMQNIEDVNRLAGGIALWRAAKAKGFTEAEAYKRAFDAVIDAHGDYSNLNTPMLLKKLPRVTGQFKKFQLNMVQHHVKLIGASIDLNKELSPEDRWVARRTLLWTVAHEVALGGSLGVPLSAQVIALAATLTGHDPDEGDEMVKDKLNAYFGKGSFMSKLLHKGAPYALIGVDTSGSLGMGNLFSPAPYTDTKKLGENKDENFSVMGQLVLGATGVVASNVIAGVRAGMEGDYYRALEGVLPKGPGNAVKALRLHNEGLTKRNGDVLMTPEQVGTKAQVLTALGFRPSNLADQSSAAGAMYSATERFSNTATQLKRQMARADKAKDATGITKAREGWTEMQEGQRKAGIRVSPMSELLKAPSEQRKRERNTLNGVQFTKSTRAAVGQLVD